MNYRILAKKYTTKKIHIHIFNKKLINGLLLLQYHVAILRTAIVYQNFIFTQEYAFVERCSFLTFSLEGKIRKNDNSVKRKHTKNNENLIFSVLFKNFARRKFFFSCSRWQPLQRFSSYLKPITKNINNYKYHILLMHLFC